MPTIFFNEQAVECAENESVLDALIRHKIDAPYSCQAGICQTCMLRCSEGEIPAEAQSELKPNLRTLGYFLSCQCKPQSDMRVELPDSKQLYVSARLLEKTALSPTVTRLRLQTATPMYYHAGQFINLKRDDGVIRSYSLASLPSEDPFLELHVKRMPDGDLSNWLADQFEAGNSIDIEGPVGDCFYSCENKKQPILLVGSGTGLAPLIGVVRDALHNNHTGPIKIYHGAFNQQELYLNQQLNELAAQAPNVEYHSIITGEMPEEIVLKGQGCDQALSDNPDLKGWKVYLCGAPAMVKSLQQRVYLAGVAMQDIHTDPFETRDMHKV